jgi:hypothetical protein
MKRQREEQADIEKLTEQELCEKFSSKDRCVLFLHSGLEGRYDLCERLAATVDLSSDDMTDAVVDVLIRDKIARATKSGLVAGLVRNGAADDVVNRTRTGLLELAARCLNDIIEALGKRGDKRSIIELPYARETIESYLSDPKDVDALSRVGDISRLAG